MKMLLQNKIKLLCPVIAIFLPIISLFFDNSFVSAVSIHGHSQGATITEKYFIYTDHKSESATSILRCDRSGDTVKNCKTIITTTNLGHANALDYVWGSNFFAVYDGGCNPRNDSGCVKGCYNLNGKSVSKSNCKERANNSDKVFGKDKTSGCVTQGFAQYTAGGATYFLKGFWQCKDGSNSGNKIVVYKNNKRIKVITNLKGGELEDVMVDGKTGKIYYTISGRGSVNLYSAGSSYTLPKSSSSPKQSDVKRVFKSKTSDKNSTTPVESTYDGTVDTVLFGEVHEDGDGCSVFSVLNLIIEILTYGIGIAAVIGISVSGLMYLTAKGDEAQATKSKKRIFEIIIGLALYVVLWALLNWLLPGGTFNNQC